MGNTKVKGAPTYPTLAPGAPRGLDNLNKVIGTNLEAINHGPQNVAKEVGLGCREMG